MTTKILIVNLGPGPVNVIAHDPNNYSKYSEQTLEPSQFASELYLHSGQRVTVIESPAVQPRQTTHQTAADMVYGAGQSGGRA